MKNLFGAVDYKRGGAGIVNLSSVASGQSLPAWQHLLIKTKMGDYPIYGSYE